MPHLTKVWEAVTWMDVITKCNTSTAAFFKHCACKKKIPYHVQSHFFSLHEHSSKFAFTLLSFRWLDEPRRSKDSAVVQKNHDELLSIISEFELLNEYLIANLSGLHNWANQFTTKTRRSIFKIFKCNAQQKRDSHGYEKKAKALDIQGVHRIKLK